MRNILANWLNSTIQGMDGNVLTGLTELASDIQSVAGLQVQ